MSAKLYAYEKKFIVLLVAFAMLRGDSLLASNTEDRLTALEQRLAQLEANLEQLLQTISKNGPIDGVQQAKTEVQHLSQEVQSTKADSATVQAALTTLPLQDNVSPSVITPAPSFSEEIQNIPYAGYMETHLNHDNLNPTIFDFHRFVLMFGHGFGDHIRFWSELEVEHAFVEGQERSGEISLEQAYLDFLVKPKLNFRAGMVLAPLGIINERHEPPSFNGVERPFVDTFIIPTTWFGSGGGILGDLGKGFSYKAYLMTSLDATGFSAAEGWRGGLQNGFLENAQHMAPVGRLEYRGIPGLKLGTSFWTGETGFNLRNIKGQARLFEFDGRYQKGRFEGRGEFAHTHLDNAAEINRALQRQTGINPNIAESMLGFYLEGGVHLLPEGSKHDLVSFYRYEYFNTQYRMPAGFLPLKQFDRSAHVVGVTYYPYPDIALKFNYNFMRNTSEVVQVPNRWDFGIGWWF